MIVKITEVELLKTQIEHEKEINMFYKDKIKKLNNKIAELKCDNETLINIIESNGFKDENILNGIKIRTKM